MNNIFEQLFQYGFHDTEISTIINENLEIKINFNKGIYLLNENGKETILSKPIRLILKINSKYDSLESVYDIKEYGKKVKYIDYSLLEKYLKKESFKVLMVYYSSFNNCILFDGGIFNKEIMFSIEGIDEIIIQEL